MRQTLFPTLGLVLAISGCASPPKHPALRTALIATGAAIVAGSIHHDRDEPHWVHIPRKPDCDKGECR